MPAAFRNDEGDLVKECTKCKQVQPVAEYYNHTPGHSRDGYKPRCRTCTSAQLREQNALRAKKRKQKSHKLTPRHVEWIRERQSHMSTRETAREFSNVFFDMKINASTVSRVWNNLIHSDPGINTSNEAERSKRSYLGEKHLSIYDIIEGASEFSGSLEEYLEEATADGKKIKF